MSKWRPIETAPKDMKEPFVALTTRGKRVVGHWFDIPKQMTKGRRHGVLNPETGRWYAATHWMPLPEPPETSE